MIAGLANSLRQHGQTDSTGPRTGTITSYDKDNGVVKVAIQPEGRETNWIKLDCPGVGNGWGMQIGPQIGDEVTVSFDSSDPNLGKVTARHTNSQNLPLAVPSGETWMVHPAGSVFKLHNDGSVELIANTTLNVTAQTANVTATTSANVTSPIINLRASGQTLLKFVTEAFMTLFNAHTHASAGAGAPNTPMTSAHMTTTVKGA
ncbi:phage baseplate assembly protein V [Pseudomonas fluorescens]|uniref:phage baseplate assembly protein V n=1 Tax=Pseudomonas fluorescens TaxID=294 RepID=UPI003D234C6C